MIPLFKVHIPQSVDEPLLKVLHSGYIGQGVKVDKFEEMLVPWVGNKNVLTVNSGTSALQLALRLANIGYGDSVISTSMTCSATNTAIVSSGADIAWADSDPKTGNIDPNSIESLITTKTKAIMTVDFGGYPCDFDEINAIAKRHGLKIIEDAAQAFGSVYKGQKIGSLSDFTEFSFQAIKVLTTGDGGLLTMKSEGDCNRGRLVRWYGMDRTKSRELRCIEDVPEAGFKYHMNDLNAVIGIEQLNYLDYILRKHRDNAAYYDSQFRVRDIERCKPLIYKNDRLSTYWLYIILVDNRDKFVEFMEKKGVHCSRVHVRNDWHSCFRNFRREGLLGTKEFDDHQCSIPVGWWVTEEDRKYIMDMIEQWDKEK